MTQIISATVGGLRGPALTAADQTFLASLRNAVVLAAGRAAADADRAAGYGVDAAKVREYRDQTAVSAEAARAALGNTTSQLAIVVSVANDVFASRDVVMQSAGISKTYATKAALQADPLPGPNAFVQVLSDASYRNRRTIYQNQAGALVRVSADAPVAAQTLHVGWVSGSDATGNGSRESRLKSVTFASTLARPGDTIQMVAHEECKEPFGEGFRIPDGVEFRSDTAGRRVLINAFDPVPNVWTDEGNGTYFADIAHNFPGASAGGRVSGSRWYLGLICPVVPLMDFFQPTRVEPGSQAGVTDAASAIAFVKANPGFLYVEDISGRGCSYYSGYLPGTYRYHLHLPSGTVPTGVQVKQRKVPGVGRYCTVRDIEFFGGIQHDGIASASSSFFNVTHRYPGYHAFELPGCYTEDLEIRDGNPGWTGYGGHHFGDERQLALQRFTHHVRPRWINWPGTIFGCHGGGSGANNDMVQDLVLVEDGYIWNATSLGDMGATTFGIVFNRLTARLGTIELFGSNMTINNSNLTFDGSVGNFAFQFTNYGDRSLQVNSTAIYSPRALVRANGTNSTKLHFNDCPIVVSGGPVLFNYGTHGDLTFTNCAIELDGFNARQNLLLAAQDGYNGGPVSFTDCAIGGYTDARKAAGVTVTRTTQRGSTGLYRSDDLRAPVAFHESSCWPTMGCGFVAASEGADRQLLVLTHSTLSTGGGGSSLTGGSDPGGNGGSPLPPGFVPRGVCATRANGRGVMYGEGGRIVDVPGYPAHNNQDPAWNAIVDNQTLVTSPTIANLNGHVRLGNPFGTQVVFVLGDGGAIVRYDGAAKTAAAVNSPVAYKLRKGATNQAETLIAVGSADDNSAGGVIYSKDSGATWQAAPVPAGGSAGKLKTCTWVPGAFVVAGENEEFWWAADPAGPWARIDAQLDLSVSYRHMEWDQSRSRLIVAGGDGASPFSRKSILGYIDVSGPPANWKAVTVPSPLPSIGGLVVNPLEYAGATARQYTSVAVFASHGLVSAESARLTEGDWSYNRPRKVKTPGALSPNHRQVDDFLAQ